MIRSNKPARSNWLAPLTVVLILFLWLGFLEQRELFHPDEGRYAEIPREMVVSGDWITPRLNGLKYFEKPVLQYWATAVAYRMFGVDEWTARLWTAMCGLFTLVLAYLTARRLSNVNAARVASLALASSFQFLAFGQILTLDMGVTCFLTLALAGWFGALDERLTPGARRKWALAMWAAMGLAVLSKGLIGVVLPGLVLAAHLAATRTLAPLRELDWRLGTLVLLAVVLPWFVAVQWINPEFSAFFFVHEHFDRFARADHHRPGPWYFFPASGCT